MPNQLGIVHPGLLATLRKHHYPHTVTIQQATEAVDAYGVTTKASWANLDSHVDLPCRLSPENRARQEQRGDSVPYIQEGFIIAISGHYPTVTAKMRAVVDSVVYDIQAVEHDGNSKTTRLRVQIVE